MFDYFLKYNSEAEMVSDFKTRFNYDEESKSFYADGVCIDIIGTIYKQLDEERSEAQRGFHVNVRSTVELVFTNSIKPDSPVRVWA